jgi:hypothetical protein
MLVAEAVVLILEEQAVLADQAVAVLAEQDQVHLRQGRLGLRTQAEAVVGAVIILLEIGLPLEALAAQALLFYLTANHKYLVAAA